MVLLMRYLGEMFQGVLGLPGWVSLVLAGGLLLGFIELITRKWKKPSN